MLDDTSEVMVQGAGFEPAKHYAPELKSGPFDQLGYPCKSAGKAIGLEPSGTRRPLLGAWRKRCIDGSDLTNALTPL